MSSPYKNVSPKKVCGQLAIDETWIVCSSDGRYKDVIAKLRFHLLDEIMQIEKLTENLNISKS